ncbi:hypothetical protein J6590_021180 [Homalodisca vitripennis]|nr:hypothetical protein J6590_021180 [Homalodisca vitripennis]
MLPVLLQPWTVCYYATRDKTTGLWRPVAAADNMAAGSAPPPPVPRSHYSGVPRVRLLITEPDPGKQLLPFSIAESPQCLLIGKFYRPGLVVDDGFLSWRNHSNTRETVSHYLCPVVPGDEQTESVTGSIKELYKLTQFSPRTLL